MKYSKLLKLSAVGLALLLIPRRSSRQSQLSSDADDAASKHLSKDINKSNADNAKNEADDDISNA